MLPTQADLRFWNQKHTPGWANRIVSNSKAGQQVLKGIQNYRAANPVPTVNIDVVINSHVPRKGSLNNPEYWTHNTVACVRMARKLPRDIVGYLLEVELDPGLPDRQARSHRAALVRKWRLRILKERNRLRKYGIPGDYKDFLEAL